MNRLSKFFLIGMMLVLTGALVIPVAAQEAGQGGIVIEGNFGGDIASLNPIIASDTASRRIISLIFPALLGVNADTATLEAGLPGGIAESYEISEDGTVYTFNLRGDVAWNDGTPITSADFVYSWTAITTPGVETPLAFLTDSIASVEAPDAQTLVVTFTSADCTALSNASSIYPLPSHIMPADPLELNDGDFNFNPSVSYGPFRFGEFVPGERVTAVAEPTWTENDLGFTVPAGFIYKNVPDQTVLFEQFVAGETNFIDGPAVARRAELRENADVQGYDFPGNAWDYLALNYADPSNPQNATDADGNRIEQGNHPLFGDVRVREAIAKGINVDEIVEGAVFGEGSRMTSLIIPASWAYASELPPIGFDPEASAALLAEAGFADADGNGVLEATEDAMYAAPGTEFRFTLYTNQGNTRRAAVGQIVQDQLSDLGIVVDFQTIDFNTLLDIMDSQTFDAFILGWRNSYPDDPDLTQLFTGVADVVGSGSNMTSYYNQELEDLNSQAKALPGCDPEERTAIYVQMQEIMQKDLPYIPLFVINGNYSANAGIEGFDPRPSNWLWNVDTWNVITR